MSSPHKMHPSNDVTIFNYYLCFSFSWAIAFVPAMFVPPNEGGNPIQYWIIFFNQLNQGSQTPAYRPDSGFGKILPPVWAVLTVLRKRCSSFEQNWISESTGYKPMGEGPPELSECSQSCTPVVSRGISEANRGRVWLPTISTGLRMPISGKKNVTSSLNDMLKPYKVFWGLRKQQCIVSLALRKPSRLTQRTALAGFREWGGPESMGFNTCSFGNLPQKTRATCKTSNGDPVDS